MVSSQNIREYVADIEMDTTTALQFHPDELVHSTFFRLPAVILLVISFAQLVFFGTLMNLSTLFHHSNLAVPEKWDRVLLTVMVTPNMHLQPFCRQARLSLKFYLLLDPHELSKRAISHAGW